MITITKKLDDVGVARAKMLKVARNVIRLKHSLLADEELNATLPNLEAAFWQSVSRGELPDDRSISQMVGDIVDAP